MSPQRLLLVASLAAPLSAATLTEADLGNQPLAIGAGPRALGMGGAFSAVADDATACTWNPAGLVQLERPEVAASLGWYHATAAQESGPGESGQFLRADHISAVLPFFAFGCQQSLGLAWQRQFDYTRNLTIDQYAQAPDPDFPDTIYTDRSHSRTEQAGALATLGLSYALEIRPGLSFGATLNQWADRWTGASHYRRDAHSVTANTTTLLLDPLDPTSAFFETTTQATYTTTNEARVTRGTSLVLGGWWQATPSLALALVFKPGYRLDLETTSHRHTQTVVDGTPSADDHFDSASDTELHHPPSLTIGGAWRHADTHTITGDFTATRWSQYYIEDGNGRRNPVNFAIDPSDNRDLWSLRVGYEYVAILPRAVLVPRVGALVELLPAATAAPSVFAADQVEPTADRWVGVTAGLSVCLRQVIWDLGAQVRHGNDVGAGQFANPASTVDLTITTVRLGVTWQF